MSRTRSTFAEEKSGSAWRIDSQEVHICLKALLTIVRVRSCVISASVTTVQYLCHNSVPPEVKDEQGTYRFPPTVIFGPFRMNMARPC